MHYICLRCGYKTNIKSNMKTHLNISGLQKRSHCYSELGKRCVIKT